MLAGRGVSGVTQCGASITRSCWYVGWVEMQRVCLGWRVRQVQARHLLSAPGGRAAGESEFGIALTCHWKGPPVSR